MKTNQPKAKATFDTVDMLIEVLALSTLVLLFILVFVYYNKLPDVIPTHFNAEGKADNYGNKISVIILPLVALFINLLFSVLTFIPHVINYSVKITEENAVRQYTLVARLLRLFKCLINILFLYISYTTIQAAFNKEVMLGKYFLPFILFFTIAPTITYIFISYKKK